MLGQGWISYDTGNIKIIVIFRFDAIFDLLCVAFYFRSMCYRTLITENNSGIVTSEEEERDQFHNDYDM